MCLFIETICVEDGCAQRIRFHNDRLNRTRREVYGAVEPLDLRDYIHPESYRERTKCRVAYAAAIRQVEYAPYHLRQVKRLRCVADDTIDYHLKSNDRSRLNALFALRGEADDVLIVRHGLLTDTSIANVALWNGKQWVTPSAPLLAGTRRAELLEQGRIVLGEIPVAELEGYSRIRLFNALIAFGEVELSVDLIEK